MLSPLYLWLLLSKQTLLELSKNARLLSSSSFLQQWSVLLCFCPRKGRNQTVKSPARRNSLPCISSISYISLRGVNHSLEIPWNPYKKSDSMRKTYISNWLTRWIMYTDGQTRHNVWAEVNIYIPNAIQLDTRRKQMRSKYNSQEPTVYQLSATAWKQLFQ